MERTINISGKEVRFKATAAIPRIYRIKFHRDIIVDMQKLAEKKDSEDPFSALDLTFFEDMAYIMAKHANPQIPASSEERLEEFETVEIYQGLPELLELWSLNVQTQSESKKKLNRVVGK